MGFPSKFVCKRKLFYASEIKDILGSSKYQSCYFTDLAMLYNLLSQIVNQIKRCKRRYQKKCPGSLKLHIITKIHNHSKTEKSYD